MRKNRDSEWSAAIDIVLETTDRLFIGEAKLESTLGSDSDHVLVHQLIRQYVMAHLETISKLNEQAWAEGKSPLIPLLRKGETLGNTRFEIVTKLKPR